MKAYCDLHTHSCFSDGTDTPAEIIAQAKALRLSAVALTDHNTVEGLPDFLAAAADTEVAAIPGVEVSAQYRDWEVHILGLFLKRETWEEVSAFLDTIRQRKEESNRLLARALTRGGYEVDYEQLKRQHPDGSINRANIARVLVEKGYVGSVAEAFRTLLSPRGAFYVPPQRMDAFEVIRFLKSAGAVPVLAHPYLSLPREQLLPFLREGKEHGLAAMETYYSEYSPETAAEAAALAQKLGLKESGGSDYHGTTKPNICLGTGRGDLRIPAVLAEALKEA